MHQFEILSNKSSFFYVEVELENIQERYVQVLRSYLQHTSPHNPGRLGDLLAHIPEVDGCNFFKKLILKP